MPMEDQERDVLIPTTTYVLGVTTGFSSSTLISVCFSVSLTYSSLSSEGGSLWSGSVESCMVSSKEKCKEMGGSVND
jgi:hypothetical protein